jgi:hypothetical protein
MKHSSFKERYYSEFQKYIDNSRLSSNTNTPIFRLSLTLVAKKIGKTTVILPDYVGVLHTNDTRFDLFGKEESEAWMNLPVNKPMSIKAGELSEEQQVVVDLETMTLTLCKYDRSPDGDKDVNSTTAKTFKLLRNE